MPGELVKAVLERALEAELTAHLGYGKPDRAGHRSGNSRNGTIGWVISRDTPGRLDKRVVVFTEGLAGLWSRAAGSDSRRVRRASTSAAAVATSRATPTMDTTMSTDGGAAIPEPKPLARPCKLISRGATAMPTKTPPPTPSAVRIVVFTTKVAITCRGVSPIAASTPVSCW